MITAEQAKKLAASYQYIDLSKILEQIVERAKEGKLETNIQGILNNDDKDYLESLGYAISFHNNRTFINW